MNEQKAILVTGYKAYELGVFNADHPGIRVIRHCLRKQMRELIDKGAKWIVISGQSGVELLAGEICLDMKKEYPEIRLAVLVPFIGQDERYREWEKELYDHILGAADFTGAISNRPYEGPWQLRQKNRFLVEKTDGLLLIYDDETPGTPRYYLDEAARKASKKSYPIYRINRYDFESATEDLQQQDPKYWS